MRRERTTFLAITMVTLTFKLIQVNKFDYYRLNERNRQSVLNFLNIVELSVIINYKLLRH